MTKKIYVIAGEASGDVLGAALMRDLKSLGPHEFYGVGGSEMTDEGLHSIFPMTDLSVMGVSEVIAHLPKILQRYAQTVASIKETNPDILVTIDSPDFCLRVAKKIKKTLPHIKIIHMVAPTVWAWRPGRAKKISKFLDGLMCLFPFEPRYFTPHGLKTAFIGHPLVQRIPVSSEKQKSDFCDQYGIDRDKPILCLLPGSRRREITTLWPVFLEVVQNLKRYIPNLQIIVPTLPHVADLFGTRDDAMIFITNNDKKYTAMQVSNAALHASGTVALELALCGTPMVTTYKVSPFSAWLGRKLLKIKFVNLVNILLGRPVVPEMIQEHATAAELAPILQALLTQPALNDLQKTQLEDIRMLLSEKTGMSAAHFVLNMAS